MYYWTLVSETHPILYYKTLEFAVTDLRNCNLHSGVCGYVRQVYK